MEKFAKQYGIPIGLVIIKLLVTLRTGIDTYHVSGDLLDVIVIDGVYLVLWLIAAYSGKGANAMALRPFAAGGAWVLYGLMLWIAVAAGQLQGGDGAVIVSLIARVAGAVVLLYDTYDYVQVLVQLRSKEASATWKDSLRTAVGAFAYLLGALLAAPFVLVLNAIQVVRDYSDDSKLVRKSRVVIEGHATPVPLPEPPVIRPVIVMDGKDRKLIEGWTTNPYLSNAKAGKAVGLSGEAVRLRLKKLQQAGVVHVNGHGIEIVE